MTLTLEIISPRSVGVLLALFERAVGLYAELIDVNAYDQPGVESGKQCAASLIELQGLVLACAKSLPAPGKTARDIAALIGRAGDVENVFHLLDHLASSQAHNVARVAGATALMATYHGTKSSS